MFPLIFSFCGFQNAQIIAVTESLIEMNPLSVRPAEYHSMNETLTISMAVVINKPSDGQQKVLMFRYTHGQT